MCDAHNESYKEILIFSRSSHIFRFTFGLGWVRLAAGLRIKERIPERSISRLLNNSRNLKYLRFFCCFFSSAFEVLVDLHNE